MQSVSSILVVVDRGRKAVDAVAKAVLLARKFQARVELFMCDAERGYALSQAYVLEGVEAARKACVADTYRHLDDLRHSAAAEDVQITIDATCESPLYEVIVRKVLRDHPDLVIKSAGGSSDRGPAVFDTTDWQLMRTCPATLMLTRGRPWQQPARFAAAIDASAAESAGLARDILGAARNLAGCVGGELDVLYAESLELADEQREQGSQTLRDLVAQATDITPRVHVIAGNPEVGLPGYAKRRDYDAMLLGALTHRPGYTAQVGSLTSKLVEAVDCDFILVKPSDYRSPIRESCARLAIPVPR